MKTERINDGQQNNKKYVRLPWYVSSLYLSVIVLPVHPDSSMSFSSSSATSSSLESIFCSLLTGLKVLGKIICTRISWPYTVTEDELLLTAQRQCSFVLLDYMVARHLRRFLDMPYKETSFQHSHPSTKFPPGDCRRHHRS